MRYHENDLPRGFGPRAPARAKNRAAHRLDPLAPTGTFPVIDSQRAASRAYLDSASTSQKPAAVIEAVADFYRRYNANIHRGLHQLSEEATEAYESTRRALGDFIGAERSAEEIIFCRGATEAINLVAHSWGNKFLCPGDEIVVTTMEHHSNLVPWQLLCGRTGARLVELKPDERGLFTAEGMEAAIGARTKLVAMTHISNLLGTINDAALAARITHDAGGLLLVDGAQALGHIPVDVGAIGCDLYVGSGHKMFAPTGTGFLYGRAELLDSFDPFMAGGEMIDEVFVDRSTFAPLPAKLEAGTPNIAGVVGVGAALDFLNAIGMDRVRAHDRALVDGAIDRLASLPSIEVYGPLESASRSGLLSFNVKGIHAHDVGSLLNAEGVAVRAGHLCAQPMLRHLGKTSCVRASFALYNDGTDMERLIGALRRTADLFGVS